MKTELDWINEARKHLGLKELNGSNKHPTIDGWAKNLGASWVIGQPWCGTYVAHCLKTAGVKYPKNWYRALAYASEGGVKLKKPAYGCVAVKSRNGGGHVCFVVGRDQKTNKLVCLGGNQSNMVCFALHAGFYKFKNILFRSIMCSKVSSFFWIHYTLKKRTKNCRTYFAPI